MLFICSKLFGVDVKILYVVIALNIIQTHGLNTFRSRLNKRNTRITETIRHEAGLSSAGYWHIRKVLTGTPTEIL